MERIRQASDGFEVEVIPTTVTLREHGVLTPSSGEGMPETAVYDESIYDSGAIYGGPPIYETAFIGESLLGHSMIGGDDAPARFEAILSIISDGSFSKEGQREELSKGQRAQLRDTMILEAHVREGRHIFVSDDRRAFIARDGEKRRRLEALCRTQIRTVGVLLGLRPLG
jgi:hypothetical protein